jgi:hypothetical protein
MTPEDEKTIRLDLRGFQASSSPYPVEDRCHHINTSTDLQEKYATKRGNLTVFSLQAKLDNRAFDESQAIELNCRRKLWSKSWIFGPTLSCLLPFSSQCPERR